MRTQLKKITLAAAFGLALALTFSCSSDSKDDGNPSGGTSLPSSSTSSPPPEVVYGDPVTYEGETYKTVVIGTQTWMAENLNYRGTINTQSKCYDNDPTNCDKYGRLYDWVSAQDVCPSGWHLPSDAEWDVLVNYAGGVYSVTKLRARDGWNLYSGVPVGTDDFGFAALPGGAGSSRDAFWSAGDQGFWWTADFDRGGSYWNISSEEEFFNYIHSGAIPATTSFFSVRCIKDSTDTGNSSPSSSSSSSSSSRPGSSSSGGGSSSSSLNSSSSSRVVYGTPVNYGNETYQTVVFGTQLWMPSGTQTWMARNLNYEPSNTNVATNSKCLNNDPANCAKYGRLYDWATAMKLPTTCNTSTCADLVQPKHQGICPSGWHIPSKTDWDALSHVWDESLMTIEGWNNCPNGCTDDYGFAALPGGFGWDDVFGDFFFPGIARWWAASEYDSNYAVSCSVGGATGSRSTIHDGKDYWLSVRCIKD